MTRTGAFIFGTASLAAACFLAWYLNGFIFDAIAHYIMKDEVTNDLKHGMVMVLTLVIMAFATEAFYVFAFTRPKVEVLPPESKDESPEFGTERSVYDADGNKIGVMTVHYWPNTDRS